MCPPQVSVTLPSTGDALLALWKVERSQLSDIITLALKCSLRIQEEYGVRETEVGLELRVKIGTVAMSGITILCSS